VAEAMVVVEGEVEMWSMVLTVMPKREMIDERPMQVDG